MAKTIQVNGNFIITEIGTNNVSRELHISQRPTSIQGYVINQPQGRNEIINLSLEIELQSANDTSKVTTQEVISSLINKLMDKSETYP